MSDRLTNKPYKPPRTNRRGIRRVLVVEDSPVIQRHYERLLTQAGAEVATFDSAPAAIRAAEDEAFDAVLLDFSLVNSDGKSIAVELRSRGFDGPILMVTGHWTPKLAEELLTAGCDACMPKPANSQQLLTRLLAAKRAELAR